MEGGEVHKGSGIFIALPILATGLEARKLWSNSAEDISFYLKFYTQASYQLSVRMGIKKLSGTQNFKTILSL